MVIYDRIYYSRSSNYFIFKKNKQDSDEMSALGALLLFTFPLCIGGIAVLLRILFKIFKNLFDINMKETFLISTALFLAFVMGVYVTTFIQI